MMECDVSAAPPKRVKVVTLRLDHLMTETGDLRAVQTLSQLPAAGEVELAVENAVSAQERELFKFCKSAMKRKNFAGVADRSDELLRQFPNSMWAHFFRAVASKQIAGQEELVVAALAHALVVNPNFLTGWQGLHRHFLSQGGLFSATSHDHMCLVLTALLRLEPDFDNWCALVGHLWDYVTNNDFQSNRILALVSPYLSCNCRQRRKIAALTFVNYVRRKNKLLPMAFSQDMLLSFQVLLLDSTSESYRLGLIRAAARYFDGNDLNQINALLHFVHTNKVLSWSQLSAKEFAYCLLYELFRVLGPDALETVLILKRACGADLLNNAHYTLSKALLELTSSHVRLLDEHNRASRLCWGRLLYVQVLADLKLYQEAYEQVLIDLNCGVGHVVVEKEYAKILVDILAHAADPELQRFTLRLCHKYLRMFGLDVAILHNVAFINIALNDRRTAEEALKCLLSLGAIDDVIYLRTLLEPDKSVQLESLTAIDNLPSARLLCAKIHSDLNNTKQVTRSMLKASSHFHVGIAPFEYLGIHYYQHESVLKSTRYFLEAFSNYLVSCVSVNYIISLYSRHETTKVRTFFENVNSRSAITMDVASNVNLRAGLNFMRRPTETLDFHRALEKFRKVTDFYFERRYIEMVADALGNYGMHGSASDFYLMCHAERGALHVYPSVLHGTEMKVVKRRGYRYLLTLRRLASKAGKSPFALFNYGCALFDRALASYSVNNFRHCVFLCQMSVLVLSRCVAIYSNLASFWIALGNVMFTVSSVHSSYGAVVVPTWLFRRQGEVESMTVVSQHEAFVLALRCYSLALSLPSSDDIRRLTLFYVALTFRYGKIFYKELGDRSLLWALTYALDSVDFQTWQRNNLCGVLLTGLGQFAEALEFFKDAMTIGAQEDARDAEFNLGIVYLRLGQFSDAHEVFMYRRGGDPIDSLVWRSYILLHHCLGDKDTVIHYLWFLIYTIKHYPSLEQGIDYLRLICNSAKPNSSEQLKKKCLLYAILRSPSFVKLSFIGDCEVPHKLNDVTALNYFHHGEYHNHLNHNSAAEDNFVHFLQLVAQDGAFARYPVDRSLFHLAMSLQSAPIESLNTVQNNTAASALAKFHASRTAGDISTAQSQLTNDLRSLNTNCDDIFTAFFDSFASVQPSKLPPTTRKLYAEFCSRTLLRRLLNSPQSPTQYSTPPPNQNLLSDIIGSLPTVFNLDETAAQFLSQNSFIGFLEEEMRHFELQAAP